MTGSQFLFIGVPLLLVILPAVVTLVRQRSSKERLGRLQLFFVWLIAYSMLVVPVGFLAIMAIAFSYGGIPGTATGGGEINDKYYFNWHDQTYTEVPKKTWERAYFLEQLAWHTIHVPVGVLLGSLLFLLLTRRMGSPPAASASQPEDPRLNHRPAAVE